MTDGRRAVRRIQRSKDQWVKDAKDYLQKNPSGDHAAELQVALAERLQRQGDLVGAAEMYSKVKGDPEFTFTAKFKAAECYYKQLVGANAAAKAKDNKAPKVDTEQLRKLALDDLNESIKMGHEAEAKANTPAAKKVGSRDSRRSDLHARFDPRGRSGACRLRAGRAAAGRLRIELPDDEREVPGRRRMAHHGARSPWPV